MKHTPGPWVIVDRDDSIVVQTESPSKTKYGASRYACLGGFNRHDPQQYEEAKSNAHLIAAAPDLLAALQEMMEYAGIIEERCDSVATNMARRAIAKATGDPQ